MVDLMALEKQFLSQHIKKGCTAVDFTMGNGHDTAFLCENVGENGFVYAFDVQEDALRSTEKRLREGGFSNYKLILASHSRVDEFVRDGFLVGVFNLGYLPGGDKSLTTLRETTLEAVNKAIALLEPDGIVLIAVYPGHAEGAEEGKLLLDRLALLDRKQICVSQFRIVNSPSSPFFISVEKK